MSSRLRSRPARSLWPVFLAAAWLASPAAAHALPGDLDQTFSGDGKTWTDLYGGADEGESVAVQPDGKIVVAGTTRPGPSGGEDFGLARYKPNGALDETFSGDGKTRTDFGLNEEVGGVVVQPDGKIVVAGSSQNGGTLNALARYKPNGALDETFSGDGKTRTGFEGVEFAGADGVALGPNGTIVAAGFADFDFGVARYKQNGALDTSFAGDGTTRTDFAGGSDDANAVVVRPDGRVVVAGLAESGGQADFGLAGYAPNGTPDQSFSGDGKTRTDFAGQFDEAEDAALQADGKVVVSGRAEDEAGAASFGFARYNANGAHDAIFSGDGKTRIDFPSDSAEADGVALQSSGRIVGAGAVEEDSAGADFGVVRLKPNGAIDTSFAGDGRARTDFEGGEDDAQGVAVQPDGKVVAAGTAKRAGQDDFALARYLGG